MSTTPYYLSLTFTLRLLGSGSNAVSISAQETWLPDNAGPTLIQQWVNISCLLGGERYYPLECDEIYTESREQKVMESHNVTGMS